MNKVRGYVIPVFSKEMSVLETVHKLGPCTSSQVKDALQGNLELLMVMRTLHSLLAKGLLERVVVDGERFYKTKNNFKTFRQYLKRVE